MSQKKSIGKNIRSIQKKETHKPAYNMEFPKDENGVIYVRQSSLVQVQNNIHSFEMQTDKFQEHFRDKGCTGYIEIIADDEGMSGTKDIHEMPGLSRVMRLIEGKELLRGKQIGWVGAVHVNRLTRDKWLVKPGTIMKECYENDVWIGTLRMDFNFQDEYCQRVFMIEAEESARHLEWMKLVMGGGKATASSNGYYDGRFLVPGYIVDRTDLKRKKYVIYEPHAKVVRWLFHRLLELDGNVWALGREVEKMPFLFPKFEDWVDAKNIGKFAAGGYKRTSLIKEGLYAGCYKFSIDGLKSVLCNPVYIGWWLPLNGGLIENNHEPIVDEALFSYAHKRLSTHNLNGERQRPKYVNRPGRAQGILKKVLYDDRNQPMYATYGEHHGGKKSLSYDSNEKTGLSVTYRFSINIEQLDAVFLEQFLERIEALEKLNDWEDKVEVRLAAKEASQEHTKTLIQKQIKNAQRQRQETMGVLDDPDIPKTKQMRIDYANKIAGLEEKIAEWENELEAPEGEEDDEEIILYQIHSLLPDIASKWDELSFDIRLRFVGALVQKVVLSQTAPTWLKIEIYWKEAIGNIVDVGHFKRKYSNGTLWTDEEEALLFKLYPDADATEICLALPNRSWDGIQHRANRLHIKRWRGKMGVHSSFPVKERYGTLEDKKYEEENQLSPISKNTQWSK